MRNLKLWALAALWIAVATVMPFVALEPVAAAREATAPFFYVAALCADGSALLAMGCESIHL